VVARARVDQHGALVAVQGRDEGGEMCGVIDVIGGQVGHERGARYVERHVEGGAEAPVALQATVARARVGQVRGHRRRGIVGGAIVDDHEFPMGEGLCEEAVEGAADEKGVPIRRH